MTVKKPNAIDAESAKEEEFMPTLPTLEGHTVTATLDRTMWTVALYENGNPEPLLTDKLGDHVTDGPAYAATALVRARKRDLEEAAALAALDDTTAYVALRSDAEEAQPVTAEEARQILRQARQEAGPEPLRDYGAPRMTLRHSGAFWRAKVYAYTEDGRRNVLGGRTVVITPAVAYEAGRVISKGTGDGMIYPVAKPSIESYGPWVRPVDGHADRVIVSRVATGLHRRPEGEGRAMLWDEYMSAYRTALEGAGWVLEERTADGDVYRAPR